MSKILYRALVKRSIYRFKKDLPNARFAGTKQWNKEWYNQIKGLPLFV